MCDVWMYGVHTVGVLQIRIQTKRERDTVVQYIYRNIVEVIMPILTWIARATDGMMLVCYAIEVST